MERLISEILHLTDEEEIQIYDIIEEYEEAGYKLILSKKLVEDSSCEYSYILGFKKEIYV